MQTIRRVLDAERGVIQLNHQTVDEIRITHSQVTYADYSEHEARNDAEVVHLHFNLKGAYDFDYQELQQSFQLQAGQHNIMFSKGLGLRIRNRDLYVETFGLQFPVTTFLSLTQDTNDTLQRFAGAVLNGKPVLLSKHWPFMNAQLITAIQQTLTHPYTGGLQKLFLLSKCIEILVLQVEALTHQSALKKPYLKTKTDRDKIVTARAYIMANLANPPSLKEIAKVVGVNEYKLKRGFQELFQVTVFGFITRQRLELATRYLLDTGKTSSEIAYELGYASPQHFNNAFKQKFGLTPNAYRKK